MDTAKPASFPHRVLLVVAGLSPQVVTETLYALAVKTRGPVFVPNLIQVVTTVEGARRVEASLLGPKGAFTLLCRDYKLTNTRFDRSCIRIIPGAGGEELEDIRTEADNAQAGDFISQVVREITADPRSALHVSLAGGRKTMGFYAGYALSLFARPQDRLSHVLVNSPFETAKDFFYPPPRSKWIEVSDSGWMMDAATAEITLAEIPVVRLREHLPAAMLDRSTTFAEVVAAAERSLLPPFLSINTGERSITLDGQTLRLQPWPFALMALLAERRKQCLPPLRAPLKDIHDAEWAAEVSPTLRKAMGTFGIPNSVMSRLECDATGNVVSPHFSRLRSTLVKALGPTRFPLYLSDGGSHRHKRYEVPLPPQSIEINKNTATG